MTYAKKFLINLFFIVSMTSGAIAVIWGVLFLVSLMPAWLIVLVFFVILPILIITASITNDQMEREPRIEKLKP